MLKKSNKRRRTKAQIEEEKQEEMLKRQRLAADMAELATPRLQVQQAEKKASMNALSVSPAETNKHAIGLTLSLMIPPINGPTENDVIITAAI